MKSWNILGLVVFCSIFFAGPIMAQGFQRMQAARIDTLKSKLNLSDKQVTQIKDIFEKSKEEMSKNRENFMDDREAMMKAFKENNEKTYAAIEKVLTPKQNKIFRQIKADWIKRSEERRSNFGRRNN